jgi:hypothetical protein
MDKKSVRAILMGKVFESLKEEMDPGFIKWIEETTTIDLTNPIHIKAAKAVQELFKCTQQLEDTYDKIYTETQNILAETILFIFDIKVIKRINGRKIQEKEKSPTILIYKDESKLIH